MRGKLPKEAEEQPMEVECWGKEKDHQGWMWHLNSP